MPHEEATHNQDQGKEGCPTGTNLVAALEVARRLGSGHRAVTVQVGSGLKYLSGGLYS